MAVDTNVATAITNLKTAWGTLNATDVKAPGSIIAWCAVDKTSKIKIVVPGIIIRLLGTTADGVGDIDKIFKGIPATGGTPHDPDTFRGAGLTGIKGGGKIYTRVIDIILKTPVDAKWKAATRKMKKVRMRFPSIVSLNCVNHWIYNHSSADLRPGAFVHNGVTYAVSNIPVASLGEMSVKVEEDETTQDADTTSPAPTQPKGAKSAS